MSDDDNSPISARAAKQLFAGLRSAPALLLAVSGGPDSVALMWLAARWQRSLARGPQLTVATVDHGLRPEATREAREVKRLAAELGLAHRTLRWRGAKPKTGLPAAAREARYRLLAQAARSVGASHVLTAHTRDDQAETLLMRLVRGSGLAGLSAMARLTERDGIVLVRPLLDVPKSQLIATLKRAKIGFADDPTNRDTAFTRPRLRAAAATRGRGWRQQESGAARGAAFARQCGGRGAGRRRRTLPPASGTRRCAAGGRSQLRASAFANLPEEVRLRLLLRAVNALGHEGPAELGKVEALSAALDQAMNQAMNQGMAAKPRAPANGRAILKQTLAGALISLAGAYPHRAGAGPAVPNRTSRGRDRRIMTPVVSAARRQATLTRQEKPRIRRHYFSRNRPKMG